MKNSPHEPSAKERMPIIIAKKRERANKIALAFELAFRKMGIKE
jgi:septum formation topological specificity factor MinE